MQDIIKNWKTYALIGAAALAVLVGMYFKGHSDGYDEADNQWRANIAAAKPTEVARDTAWLPSKPDSGSFAVQAFEKAQYKKKIQAAVDEARAVTIAYATKEDSLKAIVSQLESRLTAALSSKLIRLSTPTLGDLVLEYYPVDESANVFYHNPPPAKVVTVYLEKPVVAPESSWTTIGRYTLGIAIGAVIGYVIASQ
jgi:hypothetical protein